MSDECLPTLILLPGLHGTDDLFGPLLSQIGGAFPTRVVTYPCPQRLSYDELLTHLERELSGERSIVLIAESFGGPLAIRFAATHPQRVRALVLAASFITSPAPRWLRHFIQPMLLRLPPISTIARLLLLAHTIGQPRAKEFRAALRRVPPHVLAGRLRDVFDVNAADSLRQVACPILYLRGSSDRQVRESSLRQIHAIRPDVQAKQLDGPHMLLQSNPHSAWNEMAQVLAELTV